MSAISTVTFFLISLIMSLIIYSLWLRIALRYFKFSRLNSFSNLIYTITDPLVYPFYRLFHQNPHHVKQYDWVSLVALLIVETIKIMLLSLIAFHALIPSLLLLLYIVADFIIEPCNLMIYAIILQVVIQFIHPHKQHPAAEFLSVLTRPMFALGQKIIPNISGFDFSPLIIIVILKVITLSISSSLPWRLL